MKCAIQIKVPKGVSNMRFPGQGGSKAFFGVILLGGPDSTCYFNIWDQQNWLSSRDNDPLTAAYHNNNFLNTNVSQRKKYINIHTGFYGG